jgi:hypothetical protein
VLYVIVCVCVCVLAIYVRLFQFDMVVLVALVKAHIIVETQQLVAFIQEFILERQLTLWRSLLHTQRTQTSLECKMCNRTLALERDSLHCFT